MSKIIQLPPHLADLIAAGEVVERPASVVKELMENSIDAGATQITVEIQNGGLSFLRVTDNGCGMAPEDAQTAFLRHATSKIRTQEDLTAIGTLGFRGEALAATAAVSHIDLLTKVPGTVAGTSLHLDAGQVTEQDEAGCPDGTTIIVRNLFYNTPARMKFMKRDSVEGSAVFSAVQKQALSRPDIAFRFLRDGKEEMHTPGDGQLLSAIYAIFGRKDALDMLPVDSHWEKTSIHGFVSKPTATRGTRAYQHFFINGRYVRNRSLSAALEEAYKNQLMVGRFPACVLHIEMPKDALDVNVHPAKTEVKFISEREVFDCIHYGVLSTLNRAPGRVEMELKSRQPREKKQTFHTMTAEEYRAMATVLQEQKPVKVDPAVVKKVFTPAPQSEQPPAQARKVQKQEKSNATGMAQPVEKKPVSPPGPVQTVQPEVHEPVVLPDWQDKPPVPVNSAPPVQEPEQQTLPIATVPFRIVGEVLDTYFLVEQENTVIFIDKHAAHERILFEKLKAQTHPIMGQLLMTPIFCSLAREEAATVLQNQALLENLGYDVQDFGDGTVVLRQIPSDVDIADAEASLSELAGKLLAGRKLNPNELRDELLHTIACKAAIKGGWHTEPAEREALVEQVLSRDDLKYCPHGRPICITLSRHQLEKQFKRS